MTAARQMQGIRQSALSSFFPSLLGGKFVEGIEAQTTAAAFVLPEIFSLLRRELNKIAVSKEKKSPGYKTVQLQPTLANLVFSFLQTFVAA